MSLSNGLSALTLQDSRFEQSRRAVDQNSADSSATTPIRVDGNTISWPDDGWYEVQYAKSFNTVSEGGTQAHVDDGVYNVINHTTGARYKGIVVGSSAVSRDDGLRPVVADISRLAMSSSNGAISIEGNRISWPNDGWYEVQEQVTYRTISEGGRSAVVPDGVYTVINHTTGEKTRGVVVGGPDVDSPWSTDGEVTISSPDDDVDIVTDGAIRSGGVYREYEHVKAQSVNGLPGGLRYQNIQFTDGTRVALLRFPAMPEIMVRTEPDGTSEFYQVANDGLEQLEPGDSIRATFLGEGTVTIDDDGQGLTGFGSALMSFRRGSYSIDLLSGQIDGTSGYYGPHFGLPPTTDPTAETIDANLWRGAELAVAGFPVGIDVNDAAAFDYYASTPEGAAILAREQPYYNRFGTDEKALFVARIRFLRDEGGIELFEQFMPKRTALLDNPVELAEYDAQFDKVFTHVSSSSTSRNGGVPAGELDLSLRTLIAADAAEAFGHSPRLIDMVISDLDRGWSVANDLGDSGGLYSYWQPVFKSMKGHITLDLGSWLSSFADPTNSYDVVAHEMVHSLDGFGNDGLDGLPAFASAEDRSTFLQARSELTTDFFSVPPSLPFTREMNYAFTNEKEFLARFSELFLTNKASAETVKAVSPELYGVLSRFFEIDY
ncbi:MAG: zinc-dependent peptidase [Granulosicoccus sp.]